METPALVFIGFMGAGKTTGARAAAAALGVKAMDTDRALEQRLGASIDEYFASHGERAFREAEEDLVAEVQKRSAPIIDDWIKKANAKGLDGAKIFAEFHAELKKVAAGQ